jgi:hypothetical protein
MLTSACVDKATRLFEEHVVCTNQEYDTVDYYHGLEFFLQQCNAFEHGDDVPPNPYIEVPLSLVTNACA